MHAQYKRGKPRKKNMRFFQKLNYTVKFLS